jgi:tRNA(His) 5'-end guanylyltransferase
MAALGVAAPSPLATASAPIWEALRAVDASELDHFLGRDGQPLHLRAPHVSKALWTALGDEIKGAETPQGSFNVTGERWISLRLDGAGFSRLTRGLRQRGVIPAGFSPVFGELMAECCSALVDKFHARCGYTQSDEMTILLAPTALRRDGGYEPHIYNGRVLKLCTMAAATVTALFNYRIGDICRAKGVAHDRAILAAFDCRIGSYATREEAMSLVLWRAYDSGVNGVSDAVHHYTGEDVARAARAKRHRGGEVGEVGDTGGEGGAGGAGGEGKADSAAAGGAVGDEGKGSGEPDDGITRKQAVRLNTHQKLQWLDRRNQLPLPSHQAHGTFLTKVRRVKVGVDPRTGLAAPPTLRWTTERVLGHVLINAGAAGVLFPEEDILPSSREGDKGGGATGGGGGSGSEGGKG